MLINGKKQSVRPDLSLWLSDLLLIHLPLHRPFSYRSHLSHHHSNIVRNPSPQRNYISSKSFKVLHHQDQGHNTTGEGSGVRGHRQRSSGEMAVHHRQVRRTVMPMWRDPECSTLTEMPTGGWQEGEKFRRMLERPGVVRGSGGFP